MRKAYMLGGNVHLRLRLHERMKHDCFVAKRAYEQLCKNLHEPEYQNITDEEAIRLYEDYKTQNSNFVSLVDGIAGTIKHE